MTALKKYQRLESPGLWRETPEAQRREVIVNLGDASLMLVDPKTELALAHWSLPAIERLNPGEVPAKFAPGQDALESLDIDDRDMIAALEQVQNALKHVVAKPGRLRGNLAIGLTTAVVLAAVLFVPGALVRHTASVIPPATRSEIGLMALDDLSRLTGAPCMGVNAQAGLAAFRQRLWPAEGPQLFVLRDGPQKALHLPGDIVALDHSLLEDQDTADVAAGYAMVEEMRAKLEDPMLPLLRYAGVRATFGLLTSGKLDSASVQGYGEVLLGEPPLKVAQDAIVARFVEAEVSTRPYAYDIDKTGETVLSLIEGDAYARDRAPEILPDGTWIGMQSICQ